MCRKIILFFDVVVVVVSFFFRFLSSLDTAGCSGLGRNEEWLLSGRHWSTSATFLIIWNTIFVVINAGIFPVLDFLFRCPLTNNNGERIQCSGRLETECLVVSCFAGFVFYWGRRKSSSKWSTGYIYKYMGQNNLPRTWRTPNSST